MQVKNVRKPAKTRVRGKRLEKKREQLAEYNAQQGLSSDDGQLFAISGSVAESNRSDSDV